MNKPEQMHIKICGMRDSANIFRVAALGPDLMGFIFYAPSPRYALPGLDAKMLKELPSSIGKVGVFVNAELPLIKKHISTFGLDYVQMHGNESSRSCARLRKWGVKVIKAFNLDKGFHFANIESYTDACDLFLFDSKTWLPGGSGHKFEWGILQDYTYDVPFLLSGGLGPDDAAAIKKLKHPALWGIDLNSRFEKQPGLKDEERLKGFLCSLQHK